MKTKLASLSLFVLMVVSSCAAKKNTISVDDLSGEKLIIIGLIEYDYSQLVNKNINGIQLLIVSEEDFSNFELAKKYLPGEKSKEYQFISKIGNTGEYELCYEQIIADTPESDNLLTLMDMQRNLASYKNNIYQKYLLPEGKIINIGKISVKYEGGTVEDGKIAYTYSFQNVSSDTLALHAFKEDYPELFEKYKNDIYIFKDE